MERLLIELENSPAIKNKNMKVLVADQISPKGVALLKQQGFETVEAYGSTPEKIKELIKDADAVIVRSETKITADVLDAADKLKAVGRAGVGVDNIDIPAASEKGVIVMNTPTGNTIATAELTFTHILCTLTTRYPASSPPCGSAWDSCSENRNSTSPAVPPTVPTKSLYASHSCRRADSWSPPDSTGGTRHSA